MRLRGGIGDGGTFLGWNCARLQMLHEDHVVFSTAFMVDFGGLYPAHGRVTRSSVLQGGCLLESY